MATTDLGEATDIEVVARLVPPSGLAFVDIGCGKGELARALAARGASVLGVEPDPVQAAANRMAGAVAGVAFAEASAEALPADDGAFDGAILGRSLHHVPMNSMGQALAEAIRVLRPGTGVLLVLEPTIDNPYSRVMRPFHDETAVRKAAQEALARHAAPRFASRETFLFRTSYRYPSFADLVEDVAGASYNAHRREDVDTPEVRALFEANRSGDGLADETRVDLFRGLRRP
jgi:ubiquinone/menaquinone biosynthesis C-methylase UbiE